MMSWSYANDYFIERGDAWVRNHDCRSSVWRGLQKFNPTRYAATLSLRQSHAECSLHCRPEGEPSASEEGLRWDMMSQGGGRAAQERCAGD